MMDPSANNPAWIAAPDLPAKRGDLTCAVSGDKIYAFGGFYDPAGIFAADSFHNTTFEFDPTTDAWTTKAEMPTARGDKAAVVLADDSIVVIGGEGHARGKHTQIAQHAVEQYHPAHDTWIAKARGY